MTSLKHTILLSSCLTIFASSASALSFNFSFNGDPGAGSIGGGSIAGTVTGTIFGLVDNASGQAATSILITSYPAGLGGTLNHFDLLDYSAQVANNFNVSGGQIIGGGFAAQDSAGAASDTFIIGPVASYYGLNNVLTMDNGNTVVGNFGGLAGITFTAVSAVPDAGSTLALLSLALVGLAAFRRK